MKETTMTASDKAVQEAHHKIDRILAELDELLRGWTPKEAR